MHVTLPLDEPWSAALTIPHDQVRVTFAYPWEGLLLLGTTDTPYEGDPAEVAATDEDVDEVLAEAGVAVDPALLSRERVLATYAGLRVLPRSDGSTVDARRETAFLFGKGGMLTVAGGKLTTYRRIALAALGRLSTELGLAHIDRLRFRFPVRPMQATSLRGSSPDGVSSRRWQLISPTSTARGLTGSSVSRPSGPSSSSESTPKLPTSVRRSCSPRRRSGRRAPRTSCTDEPRWPPEVSRGRTWALGWTISWGSREVPQPARELRPRAL